MGIAEEIGEWLDSLRDTEIEARRKSAEQRKARAEQALARLGADQRKVDARKKIVIGAAVMSVARRDADFARLLRGVLNGAVTAPRDRSMLGLDPLLSAGADGLVLCEDRH